MECKKIQICMVVNLAVRRYTGIDNIVRKYTFIYVMWWKFVCLRNSSRQLKCKCNAYRIYIFICNR